MDQTFAALTQEELQKWSKERLIEMVLNLQTLLKMKNCPEEQTGNGMIEVNQKQFDFSKYHTRHVLLKLYFLGWNYKGFAAQNQPVKTIEQHLFSALKQMMLITSIEASNYRRCESTGKGVGGFSQVISIDLRSKFSALAQMTEESIQNEINYCDVLNHALPADIRVVAWKPLYNREYNSHLDCKERMYRYFFPRSNLNIHAMREACKFLIGKHDFRNFSIKNARNGEEAYVCELIDVRICEATDSAGVDSPHDMHYVEFIGKQFLRHQIRAIMAILLLVGQEDEKSAIIYDLLDVKRNPQRPQYSLAPDYALSLFDVRMEEYSKCTVPTDEFIIETKNWIYDTETLGRVIDNLQQQWTEFTVKSQVIREMLHGLNDVYVNALGGNQIYKHCETLHKGVRSKNTLMPINRSLALDTLEVAYCDLIFDFLEFKDLMALGKTCKRLNQVVGQNLQENYPDLSHYSGKDGINVGGHKFYNKFIHKLNIDGTLDSEAFQYFCQIQPELPRVIKIFIGELDLPAVIPDCLKVALAKLKSLAISYCRLDGNIHESILDHCKDLKRFSIHGDKNYFAAYGNEWLRHQYPKLGHFDLNINFDVVPTITAEEVISFLELNRNIRKFSINNYDLINSDSWMNTDVHLNELEIKGACFEDEFCRRLNELHHRGFYKRLKLEIIWCSPPLSSINGLVKLDVIRCPYIQCSMLTTLEELKFGDSYDIANFSELPSSLEKLERLEIIEASSNDIFPFIRKSSAIKSIIVWNLQDGSHFHTETNIIDLVALNVERAKLAGAQKVTIYVKEKIYVATKWALNETDFPLIRLKRSASSDTDWNQY